MKLEEIKAEFIKRFDRPADHAVRAPGRVNLIGEHTDYNDGFVLPIAIERETVALIARRGDLTIRFASLQADQPDRVDLDEPVGPGPVAWGNYVRGVITGLSARPGKLSGADILFHSTVPLGGGLSSSASLEVAAAKALLEVSGVTIGDTELARLCQKAEHDFAGTPCGIMDQSIAILAEPGHAMLLDCRHGETRQIPFDRDDAVLLVVDTNVKHELNDGAYAERRKQCGDAANLLSHPALRDVGRQELIAASEDSGILVGLNLMRARHVVTEIERTLEAADALEGGNYQRFGELMYQSHESLRDDYEVSCAELDKVVELSRGQAGVFGARMTGGGFGGCAIVLVEADKAATVQEHIAAGFAREFDHDCTIFATRAAGGASRLF